MASRRSTRLSTFGSQFTAIISVALVLMILGILAYTAAAARNVTDEIRSNMGFIVKIDREATDADVNALKVALAEAPYTSSYVYATADDILRQESEAMGEDIAAVVDANPYNAEIDVRVKPEYAVADSIEKAAEAVRAREAVEDVLTETVIIDDVNAALSRISWILLAVAGALLVISFVLINNTVSLSIYSRRFVIHTMKLVGAKASFIRRPFVVAGVVNGVISAAIAIAVLAAVQLYISASYPADAGMLASWGTAAMIYIGLVAAGIVICGVASLIATNRYLRAGYDDIHMK